MSPNEEVIRLPEWINQEIAKGGLYWIYYHDGQWSLVRNGVSIPPPQ